MPDVLELGCGANPRPDAVHHDRTLHDQWVDVAHDLDELPWPWDDETWDEIWARDVFEHLRVDVADWLGECWRILRPAGELKMRLPAFDNPLSYRDPTHRRVFHRETFDYWDPERELWQHFGRYYFDDARWWSVRGVWREDLDLRFDLRKRA